MHLPSDSSVPQFPGPVKGKAVADPSGGGPPRPRVLLYRGGCGLRYDRESPAGLALTAAIERAVPGRARVYDAPGERLLVVEPHGAIARALMGEHFLDLTTETAPFTPPRMYGAVDRARTLQEPAALFVVSGAVIVGFPPEDEALRACIEAIPARFREYNDDRSNWTIHPPHAWPVVRRLLDRWPQARVGGVHLCACCGKGIDAATAAHQAGRRAA